MTAPSGINERAFRVIDQDVIFRVVPLRTIIDIDVDNDRVTLMGGLEAIGRFSLDLLQLYHARLPRGGLEYGSTFSKTFLTPPSATNFSQAL